MAPELPSFFIIGAPKCGTSAMAYYLAGHPQVSFSDPKEPYYWASDFPGIRHQYGVESLSEYLRLFSGSTSSGNLGGEGSTLYLASATAVNSIMEFQPDAKFIVMLRNPVDLVISAHLQELSHLNESEPSFVNAWHLQEAREQGLELPAKCYEPALLQYRKIARLGFQMDRLFRTVPRDRVHVIFFEDLKSSLPQIYQNLLSFLGLKHDGRTDFPRVNDAKVPRYRWLTNILHGRSGVAFSRVLKRRLPTRMVEMAIHAKRLLANQKAKRPPLAAEFTYHLHCEFRDDVNLLADLTGRDLSGWQMPVSDSSTANLAKG